MRKYILGLAVGLVFLVYSLVLRHQHSEPIIVPATLSNNSSSKSSNSTTTGSATSSTSSTASTTTTAQYKDGTYTGSVENAFYGNVQVSATINGGKITQINFLQSPNENPNSIYVNSQADPYLKQEAIKSQNSNVSIITGATFTSQAFIESLANALSKAKS